ncbi:MAG: cell division protein FtsI [Lachnospiraceae bacterium]|nr:cell division protein FtsI [Lachnospiraceae bacterium]
MKKKLAGLFVIVVLALVGLAIRITVINASEGEQYSKQVLTRSQQQYGSTTIPFRRGDILDANGTVLATSEKVYNLILDCKVANDKETYREPTVRALVDILGQDEITVTGLLDGEETKSSQYQVLARGLTIKEKKAFEEYLEGTEEDPLTATEAGERALIKGIWFEETYERTYPLNSVACDVLGFTYDKNEAAWGLEGYYNSVLNGVDGRKFGYFNDNSEVEQMIIQPVDGNTIVTTIDANIQQIVEKYIAQLNEELSNGPYGNEGAQNIGVIVMDPNNGEVLAMGSNNPYDLNNPRDLSAFYTEEEIAALSEEKKLEILNGIWKNYCISESFEPGSTVKPVVMAAALEDGVLDGSEEYNCQGVLNVSGTPIKCNNTEGHGVLTLSDVIKHSCNVGMMEIADKMGVEEFIKYQDVFNFGLKTGIDLSGEASGILHTEDTMSTVELATGSFGQGFTCTMIQEAAAVCSVINGGYYYQPHLVSKILDSDGSVVKNIEPTLMKQTVSSEVSALIRSYMETVVQENGTGVNAKVDGYSMGGKTGTAQKIPRGNGKYLLSFVGYVPADNPEVLIYVVVDEPNAENQEQGKYPQGLAKNILTDILPYMNVFMDEEQSGTGDTSDPADTVNGLADVNVPEPVDTEDPVEGGNRLESEGLTNEEAGIEE